jgi:dihydroorotate dehydrogenase
VAFESLQGSAEQVVAILEQNPTPNGDQQENITAQFRAMKKNVNIYCPKTAGTDDVLRAFNKALTEWEELVEEL